MRHHSARRGTLALAIVLGGVTCALGDTGQSGSKAGNQGQGAGGKTQALGAAGRYSPTVCGGFFPVISPGFVIWIGYPPAMPWPPPVVVPVRGPLIGVNPQDDRVRQAAITPAMPANKAMRSSDPARAKHLVTIGDRLFRVNNTKRAKERYHQAERSDPRSAVPRVRLAQIAIVRGDYAEAAHRLREAELVEPGWIARASDIQAIYGEPGDFHRQIARIESHLHAHPQDREAWLVLGAQWYLSGRTAKAADVFRRLDDPHRRPDRVLAAFLDATNAAAVPAPAPN